MTDNVAVLEGYTRAVIAECDEATLFLLVKPEQDFDSTFKAWDCDNQEFVRINSWLFSIEDGHE